MKKEKEWMPQNKGLREKLYVVIVILLVIVLLISVWQLGRYLIDGWKSRTFSEDLQEFVIFDDERELKNEVTDQKKEEEPDWSFLLREKQLILRLPEQLQNRSCPD